MSKYVLTVLAGLAVATIGHAQLASDNASNYSGGWTNGSNGGTGFSAWNLLTVGNAGFFTGDSTQNSRESINTAGVAFGMFANQAEGARGAFATRAFDHNIDSELKIGETFSFDISFSWTGGRRGIDLWAAADGTGFLANLEHSGNDALTLFPVGGNRETLVGNIFNTATTIEITWLGGGSDNLSIRAVGGAFDETEIITVDSAPQAFTFLFENGPTADAGNYEPYFNNLQVIPEPGTMAMLGIGLLGVAALRRRLA